MGVIAENLKAVRDRILRAAEECGRSPESIALVAVSKVFPRSSVEEALAAGQRIFGENRVQEAQGKYVPPIPGIELHMVGHLQSNKAKAAASLFHRIHSIDSIKTARRLDRFLGEAGRTMKALVQVNLGHEPQKSGIEVEETAKLLQELAKLSNLKVDGLMVLPPFFDDAEKTRPYFQRLRELRDSLNALDIGGIDFKHLSMGMTADFPEAIAEGATMIRIGTAIFGERRW